MLYSGEANLFSRPTADDDFTFAVDWQRVPGIKPCVGGVQLFLRFPRRQRDLAAVGHIDGIIAPALNHPAAG